MSTFINTLHGFQYVDNKGHYEQKITYKNTTCYTTNLFLLKSVYFYR